MKYNPTNLSLMLSLLLCSTPTSATIPKKAKLESHNDIIKAHSINDFQLLIINKISRNLDLPMETQGTSVKLRLRLDQVGNIIYAKADSSNVLVNQAVERAAIESNPLPIDLNRSEMFERIIMNIKIK